MRTGFEGQAIGRVQFDYAVTLIADDGRQLRIETEFFLQLPSVADPLAFEPGVSKNIGDVVKHVLHVEVSGTHVDELGNLNMDFENGVRLSVPLHPRYEAWTFTADNGIRAVASPGGGLTTWGLQERLRSGSEPHKMNGFRISLPILEPDEPPHVDVHYEWTAYALWLSGKYGFDNVDGHEIGLSPELVRDLSAWVDIGDAGFNAEYPPDSVDTPNFLEDCFALAKRVRAELPPEWIVTVTDPITRADVVLPLEN